MSGLMLLIVLILSIVFTMEIRAGIRMSAFLVLILAAYGMGFACGFYVLTSWMGSSMVLAGR